MPRGNYKKYKKVKIGRQVKSLKQWCEITGVDPRRARQRMTDLGWSPAEAVGLKPRALNVEALAASAFPDEPVTITYNRKTMTIQEWHKETKIPTRTIYYRYTRGWDPADILDPDRPNSRENRKEETRKARQEAALQRRAKAAAKEPGST